MYFKRDKYAMFGLFSLQINQGKENVLFLLVQCNANTVATYKVVINNTRYF